MSGTTCSPPSPGAAKPAAKDCNFAAISAGYLIDSAQFTHPPKAEVRGSNPFGRANDFNGLILKPSYGSFTKQTHSKQKNSGACTASYPPGRSILSLSASSLRAAFSKAVKAECPHREILLDCARPLHHFHAAQAVISAKTTHRLRPAVRPTPPLTLGRRHATVFCAQPHAIAASTGGPPGYAGQAGTLS